MGSGTLKVYSGHVLYGRVGTETAEFLGLRNEMIVSSFIYVSSGRAANVLVQRF